LKGGGGGGGDGGGEGGGVMLSPSFTDSSSSCRRSGLCLGGIALRNHIEVSLLMLDCDWLHFIRQNHFYVMLPFDQVYCLYSESSFQKCASQSSKKIL
jgi:hypothetical protein